MTTDTIFELRSYTLYPGRRDELIDLFEHEFVESQEAVGAHVVATFRHLDAPDRFVWLRSFADMEARRKALEAFYSGPVWRAHRDAANATMIDSDDVHLLRLVGAPPDLPSGHPAMGNVATNQTVFTFSLYQPPATAQQANLRRGRHVVAAFATAPEPNDYPQLPVRRDRVFAVLQRFDDVADIAPPEGLPAPEASHRLMPTARSRLR